MLIVEMERAAKQIGCTPICLRPLVSADKPNPLGGITGNADSSRL